MGLIEMSASAAIIIALIILVRLIAFNAFPKPAFVALWSIALLRLLLPVCIPFPASVYSLFTFSPPASNALLPALAPPFPGNVSADYIPPGLASQSAPGLPLLSAWDAVWIAGALAAAVCFLVPHLRFKRIYGQALPFNHPAADKWRQSQRVRRKVRILQSDRISAPITYGLFQPVVVLPKSAALMNEARLEYVLWHEYTHIRRFDAPVKWLFAAALCLHWFNPFVWVMYVLAMRDFEHSCDEAVVRHYGPAARPAYALTLLSLIEAKRPRSPLCSGFGKNAVEERIKAIMNYKKKSIAAIAAALILIAGITTVFATSPAVTRPAASTAVFPSDAYSADLANIYAKYEPFSLSYSPGDGMLYYKGEPVRYFEDFYPLGDGNQAGWDYFYEPGTVDVRAVRDFSGVVPSADGSYDPSGVLTGVERISSDEFRDIDALKNRYAARAVSAGDGQGADGLAELYSEYEPFGLAYDNSEGRMYYNGHPVRYFRDVLSVNGQTPKAHYIKAEDIGAMRSLWFEGGVVDVHAVRDYERADHSGYGKLIGVSAYSQEEFDARTLDNARPYHQEYTGNEGKTQNAAYANANDAVSQSNATASTGETAQEAQEAQEFLLTLKTPGYESMAVSSFNSMVAQKCSAKGAGIFALLSDAMSNNALDDGFINNTLVRSSREMFAGIMGGPETAYISGTANKLSHPSPAVPESGGPGAYDFIAVIEYVYSYNITGSLTIGERDQILDGLAARTDSFFQSASEDDVVSEGFKAKAEARLKGFAKEAETPQISITSDMPLYIEAFDNR